MLEGHAVDDADLVAVLQVPADPREVDPDPDAEALQHRPGADAGEHQELRGVDRPAGQDRLAAAVRLPELAGRLRGRRMGSVKPPPLQILDAEGPAALV